MNGKTFPLAGQPGGNYMLTVTIGQAGAAQRAFKTLNFSVANASVADFWDVSDPSLQADADKGILDLQRGLCDLAQGKKDEARAWFRRALDRDRADDSARARLVDAYYAQKDYAAILRCTKMPEQQTIPMRKPCSVLLRASNGQGRRVKQFPCLKQP